MLLGGQQLEKPEPYEFWYWFDLKHNESVAVDSVFCYANQQHGKKDYRNKRKNKKTISKLICLSKIREKK